MAWKLFGHWAYRESFPGLNKCIWWANMGRSGCALAEYNAADCPSNRRCHPATSRRIAEHLKLITAPGTLINSCIWKHFGINTILTTKSFWKKTSKRYIKGYKNCWFGQVKREQTWKSLLTRFLQDEHLTRDPKQPVMRSDPAKCVDI